MERAGALRQLELQYLCKGDKEEACPPLLCILP